MNSTPLKDLWIEGWKRDGQFVYVHLPIIGSLQVKPHTGTAEPRFEFLYADRPTAAWDPVSSYEVDVIEWQALP